jgi:hypothetical protein
VPTFFCPCCAHNRPQPSFTPPPTLCSIPFTWTHWIQNSSKACIWAAQYFVTKYVLLQMPHKQVHKPKSIGTFAKLWKTTISFNMSIHQFFCLSTWNNSAPSRWISMKFDVWGFFEKLLRKFNFHVNITRIIGTLHEKQHTFLILSLSILLRMKNVSDKSCREKRNTHFMFNNAPHPPPKKKTYL